MKSASDLRVICCPMHTQRVVATCPFELLPFPLCTEGGPRGTRQNGRMIAPAPTPGSASSSTGWPKTRFHPYIQIGGGPAQSAGCHLKVQRTTHHSMGLFPYFYFYFFGFASTQLARRVQPKRTQSMTFFFWFVMPCFSSRKNWRLSN